MFLFRFHLIGPSVFCSDSLQWSVVRYWTIKQNHFCSSVLSYSAISFEFPDIERKKYNICSLFYLSKFFFVSFHFKNLNFPPENLFRVAIFLVQRDDDDCFQKSEQTGKENRNFLALILLFYCWWDVPSFQFATFPSSKLTFFPICLSSTSRAYVTISPLALHG